jgi:hypothetical protein
MKNGGKKLVERARMCAHWSRLKVALEEWTMTTGRDSPTYAQEDTISSHCSHTAYK